MGNPHVVFYVDDIADAPIQTVGPAVTDDQRFPEGVNVEFVEVVNDSEITSAFGREVLVLLKLAGLGLVQLLFHPC